MILTTKRLKIRKFTKEDLDDLASLLADKEVMRFSVIGSLSKEQTELMLQNRILDHYDKHGFGLWAVTDLKDNFLGLTGIIMQMIDDEEWPELGFRFHPKYWGQGFATEATSAICRYAFETLGMKEIISIIDPQNTRSIELAKRIGMSYWKDSVFHGFDVSVYRKDLKDS